MMNSNIVFLKSSEINQASEILARAFNEDPMFRYLMPEVEQARVKTLKWFFQMGLRNCQKHNHIYTTSDLQGASFSCAWWL